MKNADKILQLREVALQLPSTPEGVKIITAKAVEDLCGIPASTIHATAHYAGLEPRTVLGCTVLWGVEDLIALILRPKSRRSKRKTQLNVGGIEI